MNPTTSDAEVAAERLAEFYEPVADEMRLVESRLRKEMQSRYPFVDELVRYGCMLGGKRLRPALLLLTAKACGEVREEHIVLATVLEMIHTATLVHDDVLDRAEQRRRLATVNSRWDNEASILLGDFLFSHAFFLASTTGDAFACREIGLSTNRVCEGEIRQKGSRGQYDLAEDEYLNIIDAKTAELCACACHLGAHYAGATADVVEQMTHFGRELGIAFQIADDLLDLYGNEDDIGKSLGTDLDQRLLTLPTIYTLRESTVEDRGRLLSAMQEESPELHSLLFDAFSRYDAVAYTRRRGDEYVAKAIRRLSPLSDSPAKSVLDRIARFVVDRSF
ncbi:MAG: polyprenyl synthetase family protein [Pirellulaceae bacterium]